MPASHLAWGRRALLPLLLLPLGLAGCPAVDEGDAERVAALEAVFDGVTPRAAHLALEQALPPGRHPRRDMDAVGDTRAGHVVRVVGLQQQRGLRGPRRAARRVGLAQEYDVRLGLERDEVRLVLDARAVAVVVESAKSTRDHFVNTLVVVDALDLCYTKEHVDTFVIVSGDSDFSPLVSKLRENAKVVIGVGVKNSTSDLMIANCDEFIFYDDLVAGRRQSKPAAKKGKAKKKAGAKRSSPKTKSPVDKTQEGIPVTDKAGQKGVYFNQLDRLESLLVFAAEK